MEHRSLFSTFHFRLNSILRQMLQQQRGLGAIHPLLKYDLDQVYPCILLVLLLRLQDSFWWFFVIYYYLYYNNTGLPR